MTTYAGLSQMGMYRVAGGGSAASANQWSQQHQQLTRERLAQAEAGASARRLAAQAQTASDEATAANESRYQEILSGYGISRDAEAADIRSDWQGQATQGDQDLISSGLAGTTVRPTMRAAYQRGETADLGRLNERVRRDRLGFMERRTDAYPNQGLLAQIMASIGAGGAAA